MKSNRAALVAGAVLAAALLAALVAIATSSDELVSALGLIAWWTVAVAVALGFAAVLALRRRGGALKVAATIVAAAMGAAVAFSASVYVVAPSLLFYPHFDEESFAQLQAQPQAEELSLDTGAGRLSGWLLHNAPDGAPLVVYFYGNGQNAAPLLTGFQNNDRLGAFEGYNIAVLDYPGYGKTEGEPSEASLKAFGLAVYDALAERDDVDPARMAVFGYSIGTGVATYVASLRDVDSLVLMAPYASGYDLYNSMLDVFHGPLGALVAFRMESAEFARDVEAPSLVLTSVDDEMVPSASSERLAAALPRCTLATYEGFGHNEYWASPEVRAAITDFLARERAS